MATTAPNTSLPNTKNARILHITQEVTEDDGVITCYAGEIPVALKLPRSGRVVDLRTRPDFLPMSPCPYCGAVNDKGHIPHKHVDPSLGEPCKR